MDRILLITGASSEVGMQLVKEIAQNYKRIYLQYRTKTEEFSDTVKAVSVKTDVKCHQADFSKEEDVDALIESIKSDGAALTDIVHLPAPKYYSRHFHKDEWENFDAGWNIGVRSITKILKAFLPSMSKAGFGRIVFMLSSVTIGTPPKYEASYVTVKYALLGLMKSLASEYGDKNVHINAVSPDMMETKFLSEVPKLIIEANRANRPNGENVQITDVTLEIAKLLENKEKKSGENISVI